MKNSVNNWTRYFKYFVFAFVAIGLTACSDDDDGIIDDDFTGTIMAMDQTITGNMIMVQNVTVGQDSWLVAVHSDEINSDNFIAGPLFVEEGIHSDFNIELHDDANIVPDGDEIVLKLYAEDDDGILGEWDIDDEPITDDDDVIATETITVIMEGSFSSFDENNDGVLDENEVANTYQNNFDAWDADDDGVLSMEEFYSTTFFNTDADDDNLIDEDEWNVGYESMYSPYIDDDFVAYDLDNDGFIEETEWNDAFADSVWFDTYDADGDTFITDAEWDTGLYNDWDVDNDGFINDDEYYLYSPYTFTW